jgi:hypothetical protein
VRQSGQASVELVGAAAAILLAGLIGFQILAAGYAVVMADHAAEAAAVALVNGGEPLEAARAAIPGWPSRSLRMSSDRGRIAVTLFPPSPLRILGDRLAVTGEAAVREPAKAGVSN